MTVERRIIESLFERCRGMSSIGVGFSAILLAYIDGSSISF